MSTAPTLPPLPEPEEIWLPNVILKRYTEDTVRAHVAELVTHALALAQRVEELQRIADDWAALSQDDGKKDREIDALKQEVEALRRATQPSAPTDLLEEAMRLMWDVNHCFSVCVSLGDHERYDEATRALHSAECDVRTFLTAHLRAPAVVSQQLPTEAAGAAPQHQGGGK